MHNYIHVHLLCILGNGVWEGAPVEDGSMSRDGECTKTWTKSQH